MNSVPSRTFRRRLPAWRVAPTLLLAGSFTSAFGQAFPLPGVQDPTQQQQQQPYYQGPYQGQPGYQGYQGQQGYPGQQGYQGYPNAPLQPGMTQGQSNGLTPPQMLMQRGTSPLQALSPQQAASAPFLLPPPYNPGEFEMYVQNLAPTQWIRRLGADLMQSLAQSYVLQQPPPEMNPIVPPDYLVVPGDEVIVNVWGSVDASIDTMVDRTGRITVPHVGSIMVAGVRYGDLPSVISAQVGKEFRNFHLSVSLGQLRGMRVYITGFVQRPGSYSMSSLSTVSSALINAGGPSSAGSFRDIEVRRKGQVVAHFDLYDLIVSGRRDEDVVLQPDDVIHVGPVGPQVGVLGSVNQPAIVELRQGDDLASVLHMVGGLTSVADATHVAIEPLKQRSDARVVDVTIDGGQHFALSRGDVVNIFSSVDPRQPTTRQNKRITVEGEVAHPGVYVLQANATTDEAISKAGGLTSNAYVFGTVFTRESVRQTQQDNYNKLLQDLQVQLQATASEHVSSADDAKAQEARTSAAGALLDKLRTVQPTGRLVFVTDPAIKTVPSMPIEDGDRVYVPANPTSVGVFGSVFNTGTYVYSSSMSVGDYLKLAGGPTRGADKGSTFVLRANGTVISSLQTSFWTRSDFLNTVGSLPGDTIFVPEDFDKMTGLESAKAWSQIIFQVGLGLAGVASAIR